MSHEETAYRLAIAGCPIEFVTDSSMVRVASGAARARVAGMSIDGVVLEETIDILQGKLDAGSFTVTLANVPGIRDQITPMPSVVTWLSADLSAAATTINVHDTSGFSAGDVVQIGPESVRIGTVAATSFTGCTRAVWGTTALAHYVDEQGSLAEPPVSLTYPDTLEGRRAYLYQYSTGDSALGDGTLIWAGITAADIRYVDGTRWSIEIDPLSSLLKQTIGTTSALISAQPRGIFFHDRAPFRITVTEWSGASWAGSTVNAAFTLTVPDSNISSFSTGFFVDNNAFALSLNAQLETQIVANFAGNGAVVNVVPSEDGSDYRIEVTPDSATTRYISVEAESPVDGRLGRYPNSLIDQSGNRVSTVLANTRYYATSEDDSSLPGRRSVPRGFFGFADRRYWQADSTGGNAHRIYVSADQADSFVAGDDTQLSLPLNSRGEPELRTARIDTVTTGAGALIDFDTSAAALPAGTVSPGESALISPLTSSPYTAALPIEARLARTYDATNIAELLDEIAADAPTWATVGRVPFILAGDLSSTLVTDFNEAAGAGATVDVSNVLTRRYWFGREITLEEIIKHESRLAGFYPGINKDGLLHFVPLSLGFARDPETVTFTRSQKEAFPQWERQAIGTVNRVVVHKGYDPQGDKHNGPTITVLNRLSVSRNPLAKALEIKPKSASVAEAAVTDEEIVEVVQPILGLFGSPYAVVNFTAHLFDTIGSTPVSEITAGTPIALTDNHVPSWPESGQGVEGAAGFVMSRAVDLQTARVEFTAYVSGQRVVGYAPDFYISNWSGSGTSWTITIAFEDPLGTQAWASASAVVSDFYQKNDTLRIQQWGSTSTQVRTATVSSVNDGSSTMVITLNSSLVPGSNTYVGTLDTAPSATANTDDFVFFAGSDRRIGFSTTAPARTYSP